MKDTHWLALNLGELAEMSARVTERTQRSLRLTQFWLLALTAFVLWRLL